jgi:hypothetical protein
VTVRFRGARSRNASTRLSAEDGSGAVSTRGLRRGRYRVTVWAGEVKLGAAFKVRVGQLTPRPATADKAART